MASMKVSLDGLMAGVEEALRSSRSDMACAYAYSLMEFADNLRLVRAGTATVDELFGLYVFAPDAKKLADRVVKERYDCMQDETDEDEAAE